MLVRKSISFRGIMQFAGHHLYWLTAWMCIITGTYSATGWTWMAFPWLPLSVIGTAVAFYVGFKNNQAYDRLWEARKIWGGIVNSSRMWASMVKSYVTTTGMQGEQLYEVKRRLIYRHIGWIYTLREQLLVPTAWEHVSLSLRFGTFNQKRRKLFGAGAFQDQVDAVRMKKYIMHGDIPPNVSNGATHLLDTQSQELARLQAEGWLDMFRQLELQRIVNEFYDNQGKAERIKKFPLPRQYGSLSFIFVCIFIFLLPFGIVGEFSKFGPLGIWAAVPFGVLIGWVYVVMELIGDYSENPFEGLFNDVPMFAICRTIEIDLLQMMGETDVPAPVEAKAGILM
jgi:ion channel-forming bestrophin family protein